ncbi:MULTISPECIES: DUF6153 family protein [Micromonospora]|uniref:Uncharacterized protein n=1 Tax=Micromonospora solifontis TaxID=2487138 RepID=A0ABX9WLA2_9ACTN|nr:MULTISPECIES: DUF6153 family protein [Micromonospora]NES14795.1 hypothetical protein [Micromonospora sp. PPF5-17B]NES35359.1 hypothetical protein [Micromonospora solifontis]NES56159.1 hypothetical protein [Micromonospora sp. PPF5-6]RNM00854.1 hypothetical protein EFE23_04170 [Micromonospora solifontis]
MAALAAVTGRWVQFLLLLCTLAGLTAMHTLGHGAHPPADHGTRHGTGHHSAAVEPAALSALAPMASACPGDACHVRALPLGDVGGHPSGWDVCLAVLGAFAVALLVAVLLGAGSRTVGATVSGRLRLTVGPRAPPIRPYGLRLATASVLRR